MQKTKKRISNQNLELQEKLDLEKRYRDLALLEAALYVTGRPLNLKELCSVLKTRSKKKVRKLFKILIRDYASRNSALEILELKDERYVLQLKAYYSPYVKKLVTKPLLSSGPLRTLSYLAFRQPISQKRVVEVRGRHAYGHIKRLKEMGLVVAEKQGRYTVLKTTDIFADYFGLSHDITAMKRGLKHIFKDVNKKEKYP